MKFKLTNLNIQVALALSAASALVYEVVATNVLFFYFIRSSYSIATVLSVFLFGLGMGSLLIYASSHKIKNKKILFGILQILIATYAFFVLANLTKIIPRVSTLGIFAVSSAILLIPTIFLGAIFPLAGSIFIRQEKEIIGLVYSSDLFGAITGSLIAGFLLIPAFGNKIAVLAGVGFNLLSAFIIFPKIKKAVVPLVGIIFLIFSPGFLFQKKDLSQEINSSQKTNLSQEKEPVTIEIENEYQFYANSPYGVVKVEENTLFIDEREQCSLSYPEDAPERMMVDYALDPLKDGELNVLNIGLGCGLTLSRILDKTNTTIDVVEINPVVVQANREFTDVLENPKVNLIIDDGLSYLRKTKKKYDSVIVDIEEPSVAHSSFLYTVEAFKIITNTLTEDGTFALYNYSARDRYLDILYYSLKEAFPFVYSYPGIFLASKQRLEQKEYIPIGPYEVNTIDKNTLTPAYLRKE